MNRLLVIFSVGLIWNMCLSCNNEKQPATGKQVILKVPEEYSTIAKAVAGSKEGDWIIIAPGTYKESEIEINKAITVSSEWKFDGDKSKIDSTIIDSDDKILFTINADSVEISGLKIINGNHTLNIEANVSIIHNHFINNLDGMSFESGGGGYVGYNTAENDRDDALDLDIVKNDENSGSDIRIEHNTFINSNDDGIEIRLFTFQNQNIKYTIRENRIIGSNNAGIQLISYDEFTGKEFYIHHNIFANCKTGLGCMEGAQTREDLSGATKMDELVYFYNNTVANCKMGATGGNQIIAFNNLIINNSLGGFKLFGTKSIIQNNLFFQNGENNFIEIHPSVPQLGNIIGKDPLLDLNSYSPAKNSPCIDSGIASINTSENNHVEIPMELISGKVPDIGAVEVGLTKKGVQQAIFQIDAGEDQVVESPKSPVVLAGRAQYSEGASLICNWEQVKGPEEVKILAPDQLLTSVELKKEGIYQFKINCSDGKSSASDLVTIRYVKEGEGKRHFLNEEKVKIIKAGDFAYIYGNVNPVTEGLQFAGFGSRAEFSVGMAESSTYDLWFLVKLANQEEGKLQVEFNQKEMGQISVKNKILTWIKLPVNITATPGQWPLFFDCTSGNIVLDKIIFSIDSDFVPSLN